MDNFFTSGPSLVSFKQIYTQNITPKLEAIDLFIKTSDAPYTPSEVAQVLYTSEDEITSIMNSNNISSIKLIDFFTIVSHCKSYICRLINRQWKYSSFGYYTVSMIAEIYELNILKVEAAFKDMEVETVSDSELMNIFSRIHTPVYNFSTC